MKTGLVFEIKEFAIHDGPGIRTTVFLKGCPLDCSWCHNPEGKSRRPQVMKTAVSERVAGREYTSGPLAQRLNRQAGILKRNEGGVTFSGGEPLLQAEFAAEVMDRLEGLHILLDTSGYGDAEDFSLLASRANLVYFDLKVMDPALFRKYTGGDIRVVLRNLALLSEIGVPFVVRVPVIPGVTDTEENYAAIASAVGGLPGLQRVDLLPYNRLAGAKYEAAGMVFRPNFDETRALNTSPKAFEDLGTPWRVA